MKISISIVSAALCCAFTLTSCETPGQTALAGAATGAAIGGLLHGRGSDALAGGAIGAGAGYLIGKLAQLDRRTDRYDDRYYGSYDEYDNGYPVANPTNRYGFVTSPYRPYNLIDVRGIPHGAKVVDPSRDRIFINP